MEKGKKEKGITKQVKGKRKKEKRTKEKGTRKKQEQSKKKERNGGSDEIDVVDIRWSAGPQGRSRPPELQSQLGQL